MGIELVERLRRLAKVFGGKCAEDCTEAADRIEELERDLFNLVCRIHRDGGHYIAKHGEAKAIADADTVAAQNNAYLDALQADNARLRESTELLLIARQIGHYRDEWDMLKEALAASEPKITKPT